MMISTDRLRFLINRFRERLWVRPLMVCLVSIATVFLAKLADDTVLASILPAVAPGSVETLLSIMASSMLVIATFSLGSMVSAYATASSTATPRAFAVVVADDVSQNALSTFVGAFIFSIVAITTLKNDYFESAGLFILFLLTGFVFSVVIVTFVRWVDRIARLGRIGSTISKVEQAAAGALRRRRDAPTLCAQPVSSSPSGRAVFSDSVGYVQHVDVEELQEWAEQSGGRVTVAALPGTLATPGRPLAYVSHEDGDDAADDCDVVAKAFQIGRSRLFDDDPRFGLVVLSEIAGRALSPAVNDPGTAIEIIGSLMRLFALWCEPPAEQGDEAPNYDRVEVPEITQRDLFDDAFMAIGRDGAGSVEVAVRLQKALHALASFDNAPMREAAEYHSRLALKRSALALEIPEDLAAVRDAAGVGAGSQ